MSDELKAKGLTFLSNQAPRVLMLIVTLGVLGGMAWFGKLTDVLAGCITATGMWAQWMNIKVLEMTKKKEGDS